MHSTTKGLAIMRKLVYYAAVSLDGYIAGPDGEFDFYPMSDDMSWIRERYPESIPTELRTRSICRPTPPTRRGTPC